ncbi:hypothetical protein KKC74_14710 [bacterium]|nr:hypothetical protein [bacterium]
MDSGEMNDSMSNTNPSASFLLLKITSGQDPVFSRSEVINSAKREEEFNPEILIGPRCEIISSRTDKNGGYEEKKEISFLRTLSCFT